jgi:hypothetical protein
VEAVPYSNPTRSISSGDLIRHAAHPVIELRIVEYDRHAVVTSGDVD